MELIIIEPGGCAAGSILGQGHSCSCMTGLVCTQPACFQLDVMHNESLIIACHMANPK